MSKIISAEIKKQVSRPGIFILAVLLAVILVLGVFIYKPTETKSSSATIKDKFINDASVVEIYATFNETYGLYEEAQKDLTTHVDAVKSYRIGDDTYKNKIEAYFETLNDNVIEYRNWATLHQTDISLINTAKRAISTTLSNMSNTIFDALQNANAHAIVTTTTNYDELEVLIGSTESGIRKLFKKEFDAYTPTTHDTILNECDQFNNEENGYGKQLRACLDALSYPTITDAFIADYTTSAEGSKYAKLQERLSTTLSAIETLKAKAQASEEENKSEEKMLEMQNLICSYINTISTYNKLINYELLSNALSSVSATEQLKLYQLNTVSLYDSKTNLIKFDYLFENNKIDDDFANPFTIGATSSSTTNAFDYAYFSLNLFAIVIIAYAVLTGCHSIAGEIKEGTMRYLAIRPVGRRKMFFGKLLSILIMSAIFILFSSVVAFLVGGFVYSFESLSILTIFNGTTAIVLPAMGLFGIYMLSLFIEVAVYLSIAMLLATLFKSDLLAVTIVLLLYLINLILPIFTGGINSWLAFYPFSHISFYSLFGSSIYANPSDFFYMLLGAKVYSTSNIILTSAVVVVILVVINLISSTVFKKKEL